MTVVAGDVIRTTCNFELGDGTQYQNVYHHKRLGEDAVADSVLVNNVETWAEDMYAELAGVVKDDVTPQLCFVDRLQWVSYHWEIAENVGFFTPSFSPTEIGDAIPHQSAPFLVFKTARPKSTGKKFLFPFTEAWQAGTILVGGAIVDMVAYGVDVLSDIEMAGDALLQSGVVRTGVDLWLAFTVAIVNDIIGSQKRRRPGVGA